MWRKLYLWGLLFFLAYYLLNPFVYDSFGGYSVRFFWINYVALLLCSVGFGLMVLGSQKLAPDPALIMIAGLQAYTVFISIYVNYFSAQEYGVNYVLSLVLCCALPLMSYFMGREFARYEDTFLKWPELVLVLGALIFGIYTIVVEEFFYFKRPYSTHLGLVILSVFLIFHCSVSTWVRVTSVIVLLVLSVLSGSRAQLAWSFVAIFSWLYMYIGARILTLVSVPLISLFAIVFFEMTVMEESQYLAERLLSFELTGRGDAWGQAIDRLLDPIIFVFGGGVFPQNYYLAHGEEIATAHNFYLQVFTSLGVFGLITSLFLMFYLCLKARPGRRLIVAFLFVVGITYDLNFVASYVGRYGDAALFYFFIGLSCAVPRRTYEGVSRIRYGSS